jgi:hypothetical protein
MERRDRPERGQAPSPLPELDVSRPSGRLAAEVAAPRRATSTRLASTAPETTEPSTEVPVARLRVRTPWVLGQVALTVGVALLTVPR